MFIFFLGFILSFRKYVSVDQIYVLFIQVLVRFYSFYSKFKKCFFSFDEKGQCVKDFKVLSNKYGILQDFFFFNFFDIYFFVIKLLINVNIVLDL